MSVSRYPVLMWPDASGAWSAAVVGEFDAIAASAESEGEVLQQLKECLEWRIEHEPWNAKADLAETSFIEVKVEVRPQYNIGKRIIPCPETVWLRVPCVTGLQENGMRLCVAPHFSLQFSYHDHADLKGLVSHYVKETLHSRTPAQLAACLPPERCRLEEIVLPASAQRARRLPVADRPEMAALFAVADPLLHDAGRKGSSSPAYCREALAAELARKLRLEKGNVLLVGETGVGKSTILLDAAKISARASKSPGNDDSADDENAATGDLRTYRFWRCSGGRMIAGMRYLGQWEERCEEFIHQISSIDGVFCAENLLELLQVGGEGAGASVAAFLLPYLQRGEVRMVAEATPAELEACRRLLPGLLDAFHVVVIPSFDDATAVQVLNRISAAQATGLRLNVDPGVASLIHQLHKRFRPYSAFPGQSSVFLRNLFDRAADNKLSIKETVLPEDVIGEFAKATGLPEIFLRDEILLPIGEVRRELEAKIIGQSAATSAAARLVTTIKAGLTDNGRPLSVLLFSGPTGVGKTALAKTLADYCFGAGEQKNRLIRLDMSEFTGWGAARRLLQTPKGTPAAWIEQVRRQPFCVLLFDEIEKAEPEVFDVLLGLLDEGRLTDRFGRVTWFRSAVIIMTSNLGSNLPASAGFSAGAAESFESEVAKYFRPEFFNRIDQIITFNPLDSGDVETIARKELAELAAREGFKSAGIRLEWTERLVTELARQGYDRRFGARPLQRMLEQMIGTPLARWKVAHPAAQNLTLGLDLGADGAVAILPTAKSAGA